MSVGGRAIVVNISRPKEPGTGYGNGGGGGGDDEDGNFPVGKVTLMCETLVTQRAYLWVIINAVLQTGYEPFPLAVAILRKLFWVAVHSRQQYLHALIHYSLQST